MRHKEETLASPEGVSRSVRDGLRALLILAISASVGIVGWHCLAGGLSELQAPASVEGISPQGAYLDSPGLTALSGYGTTCLGHCVQTAQAADLSTYASHQGGSTAVSPALGLKKGTEVLLEIIGDKVSRDILLATDGGPPRSAHELVRMLSYPQATIYLKLHQLVSVGLLAAQRATTGEERGGTILYSSLLDKLDVQKRGKEFSVHVCLREREFPHARTLASSPLASPRGTFTLRLGPPFPGGTKSVDS